MVEHDINKRWEQGIPHHPKSIALFKALSDIDYKHGGDYFEWKSGGAGDNGEHLMYEMDIMFEEEEQGNRWGFIEYSMLAVVAVESAWLFVYGILYGCGILTRS